MPDGDSTEVAVDEEVDGDEVVAHLDTQAGFRKRQEQRREEMENER